MLHSEINPLANLTQQKFEDQELDSLEELELIKLLEMELLDAANESYYEFFKQAWSYIDPSPFKDNWHIGCICEHLQAVQAGEIKRLIIAVPPRSGKSKITSIVYPAWVWTREPEAKFITVSHSQSLSSTFSRDTRTLLQSSWYAENWIGSQKSFEIAPDSNRIMRIDNTHGGYRIAATPRQNILGHGFTYCICDDILDGRQATNRNEKEYTNEIFFDGVLRNRSNDPETDKMIIVQQRLAEDDLPGHVMQKEPGKWFLLCLPAEYDGERYKSPLPKPVQDPNDPDNPRSLIPLDDPRTELGELLVPDRLTQDFLDSQKAVDELKYDTLYQQNPSSKTGYILKDAYLQKYTHPISLHKRSDVDSFQGLLLSADLTFGEVGASNNSIQLWGMKALASPDLSTPEKPLVRYYFLLDEQHGKWDFIQQCAAMEIMYERYKNKGLSIVLVEEKANGSAMISAMKKQIPIIEGFNPKDFKLSTNNSQVNTKIERLQSQLYVYMEGRVYIPDLELSPRYPWLTSFRKEVLGFPLSANDDRIDAMVQAIFYMEKHGLVRLEPGSPEFQPVALGGRQKDPSQYSTENQNAKTTTTNNAIRSDIWELGTGTGSYTSIPVSYRGSRHIFPY